MAKLRKFVCYRRLERPYTRKSKYSKKNFIRVYPATKITKCEGGTPGKKFSYSVLIKTKKPIQIRHNALEAARQSANKYLETNLNKDNFFMKMRVFPHHVLRENPLASGAGADRMSTGMAHSFGKNISSAAQVRKGQPVFEVKVEKSGIVAAKKALKVMATKFPCTCVIEIFDLATKKQVFY
jgi:large subunit ribosomal protein L10e